MSTPPRSTRAISRKATAPASPAERKQKRSANTAPVLSGDHAATLQETGANLRKRKAGRAGALPAATPQVPNIARRIVAERKAQDEARAALAWWTVVMPKPPSVNAMFRNVTARDGKRGGRVKTGEYHTWSAEAAHIVTAAKPPRINGPYEILIELGRRKGADLFNFEKGVSDLLVRIGVVVDDSLCEDGRVRWADDLASTEVRVSIRPHKPPPARVPLPKGATEADNTSGLLPLLEGTVFDPREDHTIPGQRKRGPRPPAPLGGQAADDRGLYTEETEAGRQVSLVAPTTRRAPNFRPSIGQGAAPHSERGNDLYQTPPVAIRALMQHEPRLQSPALVWEPACGPGAIVREMRAAGHMVIASDKIDYGAEVMPERAVIYDFFSWREAPEGVDLIVTNPPFNIANRFIRHALRLCPTAIMLLPQKFSQGVKRSDLIDHHLSREWLFADRLPFMHREGWAGKRIESSAIPFSWFVFERSPPTPGAWVTRRITWSDSAKMRAPTKRGGPAV